jgi:hypothetical protein
MPNYQIYKTFLDIVNLSKLKIPLFHNSLFIKNSTLKIYDINVKKSIIYKPP